jgi:hypothetical protein
MDRQEDTKLQKRSYSNAGHRVRGIWDGKAGPEGTWMFRFSSHSLHSLSTRRVVTADKKREMANLKVKSATEKQNMNNSRLEF